MESETKFIILTSIFITFTVSAVLLGSKLISVFGIVFAVGAIPFSLTFPITDAMCEVWGKARTKRVVFSGLLSWIILLFIIYFAIYSPPASFWTLQEGYAQVFGTSARIILGGLVGYVISQYYDIWAFMWLKKKTEGKYLWLRNNLSTASSQFIMTVIIVVIGFYGTIPQGALLSTIFGWWIVKIGIAVADTPAVYLLVNWIKE